MLSALKIEWMKVKNYRTFWILLGITAITIPGGNYYIYSRINDSLPEIGRALLGKPFAFPDVWQVVSWNSSLLFMVPALLIITLTTNEFVYKTHRQNIIDGWSRKQFVGVKLFEVFLLSLFVTLLVVLTVFGLGLLGNKLGKDISIWDHSRFALFFFIGMLNYLMIAFILSMLVKRAGLVIGVYFLYFLAEAVIGGILEHQYKLTVQNYFPEEVTDMLMPNPYKKILMRANPAEWEHHVPIYLTVGIVYIVIYCLVTSRIFLKSDL